MPSNTKPISIAIIGGGIGGLCLGISLLNRSHHINVQIYEAAPKFAEIGAGVAFGRNAIKALQLISQEALEAYLKLETKNQDPELRKVWNTYRLGTGPRAGEVIGRIESDIGQSTAHRARFLDELAKLVPSEVAHFGKRLERLEDRVADGVELYFKDGTSATADCVVGFDGLHSVVRTYLLGDEHPATNPVFAGWVGYRALIPMQEAVDAIGRPLAENSNLWVGKRTGAIHYPIDSGVTMNLVAIVYNLKEWHGELVKPTTFAQIQNDFSEWSEQKIISLLNRPGVMMWSLWNHPPAPTYFRGNVAMAGDAAHATTPFLGQGAAQAIEDASVLGGLLAQVDTPERISLALQAYDQVRRPRSQKLVEASREAGILGTLGTPEAEENIGRFEEMIESMLDWVWNLDMVGQLNEAKKTYQGLLEGNGGG